MARLSSPLQGEVVRAALRGSLMQRVEDQPVSIGNALSFAHSPMEPS
jgi:hypothetical protein